MGSSILTVQGAPPRIDSPLFPRWLNGAVSQVLTACPLARGTTYYFAQSGNDTTGDGSIGNPWKTIAKAQAVLDAGSGNIAVLFARGAVWEESTGLTLDANESVGAYGSGDRPLFNRFINKYNASGGGWTNVSGTIYRRDASSTIAWIRRVDARLTDTPICRVALSGEVGTAITNTSGTWWWGNDGGTNRLYIDIGVDPNTINLEFVEANSAIGVSLAGDGARADNIRFDGWGMDPAATSNQKHGIKTTVTGTNNAAVTYCESYYGSSHCIAHYSSSGGVTLFVGCEAGYMIDNGAGGETCYNTYSTSGGQESILLNNITTYGTLPPTTAPTVGGGSLYGHSGGTISMVVSAHHVTKAVPWTTATGSNFASLPSAGALVDARGLIYRDTIEGSTGNNHSIAGAGIASFGSRWTFTPDQNAILTLAAVAQTGWLLASEITLDLANVTGATWSFWNAPASSPSSCQLLRNHFRIIGNAGTTQFRFDFDATTQSDGVQCKGNVIEATNMGAKTAILNLGNNLVNAGYIDGNAYYGITGSTDTTTDDGFGNDANAVILYSPTEFQIATNIATPTYQQAPTTIDVRTDAWGRVCDPISPSIGPLEHYYDSGVRR